MKRRNLALLFGTLVVFAVIYGTDWDGNTEPKETFSAGPTATQVPPTPTPIEMTFDEADAMLKEKFGTGFYKPTATPAAKKVQALDPNSKSTCWVDKDGKFEMTVKECQELHDKDPFAFQVQSYKYCLEGKGPSNVSASSDDERKKKCSDLTGIVESSN